jgi:hypothetical protein
MLWKRNTDSEITNPSDDQIAAPYIGAAVSHRAFSVAQMATGKYSE